MAFPTEYRRNLPHIIPPGGTFFITFRLKGSVPKHIAQSFAEEYEREKFIIKNQSKSSARFFLLNENRNNYFSDFDSYLDTQSTGPHWLRITKIVELVVDAIKFRDGKQYNLISYCIMSNHVHMIFTVQRDDIPLYKILGSLKRHTARHANKVLKREGAFWQAESYDHLIRDRNELARTIDYVLNNPVKAKLVSDWNNWKHSYVKESYLDSKQCSTDCQSVGLNTDNPLDSQTANPL